jgi:predicted RNase H-like HicB family nuclease
MPEDRVAYMIRMPDDTLDHRWLAWSTSEPECVAEGASECEALAHLDEVIVHAHEAA